MFKLSILISTKNREKKLMRCLNAIGNNIFQNYNIIIVDQSPDISTKKMVMNHLLVKKIKYIRFLKSGKASGLNYGLKHCDGDIIVFTDDDCIPQINWLFMINEYFNNNPNIFGVFGRILPYKPRSNINKICVSTFASSDNKIVNSSNIIHYQELGLGNNMAYQKKIFSLVGRFKNWLGPGIYGMAGGEEGEFIYRILNRGYKLAYEPKITVYHNNWLDYHQEQILQGRYSLGIFALCSYILFKDFHYSLKLIKNRIKHRIIFKLKRLINPIFNLNIRLAYQNRREMLYIFWESFCFVKGFIIGFYYRLL